MERFIDDFSKQLAKAVSRRDVLSVSARTMFAAFVSSTGIGRLWGQTTSTSSCPACGTCQMCNTRAGKCGLDCENPCTSAVLCSQAQQFQPYLTLQSFLAEQFTGGTSEPQALVFQQPSMGQTTVLSTGYTGTDPSQTATLFFTVAGTGAMNAVAIQINNGVPRFGYFVSTDGQVHQILPPFPPPTTVTDSGATAVAEATLGTNTSPAAASKKTHNPNPVCETLCDLACHNIVEGVLECEAIFAAACVGSGPLFPECVEAGAIICFSSTVTICLLACQNFTDPLSGGADVLGAAALPTGPSCPIMGGEPCGSSQCGTCETCINGVCVATTCPSGYSCDGTIGACVCNNLCGTQCCASGQTCSNGSCTTTTCPSGTIACGTTCCSAATQACLNGACVTSTCGNCTTSAGPGTSFCGCSGGAFGLECCPPGSYCADPTVFICCTNGYAFCGENCCPPGTSCCGTQICCPNTDVCIQEAPGIFACVSLPS